MLFNLSFKERLHIFDVNFTTEFSFFGTILHMRTNPRKEKAGSCFAFNARTSTWKLGVCSKQIRWLWAGAKKEKKVLLKINAGICAVQSHSLFLLANENECL